MFSTSDTIVAIATPPGRGGIGVVRLAGPDALAVAQQLISHRHRLEPRRATLTYIGAGCSLTRADQDSSKGSRGERLDQVVATYFPAPASYTGDDVVELSAHGSPVVLGAIVTAALDRHARLAEPGEFTLRAFLNGRIDLTQAEAVADLIDAATPLQARAAFDQLDGTLTRAIAEIDASVFDLIARLEASVDFPEEGYHFVDPDALARSIEELTARTTSLLATARRGRLIREGLQVAIVGAPNVGKSSLFNALVGASRAIVTAVPGTTRDLVTEVVDLDGLRVTLVDTAGLRPTSDPVEAEGVERSHLAISVADLVLRVHDSSSEYGSQIIDDKELIVSNKSDLAASREVPGGVSVSAVTGKGLDQLRRRIVASLNEDGVEGRRDRPALSNIRHIALVQRAHDALGRALAAARAEGGSMSEEFLLADLQDARAALEEVSGRRAPDELLARIFSRFCIGK